MAVSNISTSKKNTIISKSVNPLPNNPSRVGYSASDIKGAMFKFVTDDSDSVIAEINRIVNEVNAEFEDYTKTESLGELATKDTVDYETEVTNKPTIPTQASDIGAEPADSTILKQANVVNNVTSTSTTAPLSANMGKTLQTEIDNLKSIGRFLAIWNATTGVATSEPTTSPYEYKTGDYFRVGVVGNRIPTGTSYTVGGTNYTTTTDTLSVGDVYYFDGTTWSRQASSGGGTVQDVQVDGVSVLTGGIADIKLDVYWCSSSTTYAQITQALTDGKMPVYKSGNFLFYYAGTNAPTNTIYYFVRHNATTLYELHLSSDNTWSVVSSRVTVPQERTIAGVDLQDNVTTTELQNALKGTASTFGTLKPDGTTITVNDGVISSVGGVSVDNSSITTNSSDEIQTVGVIDQKTSSANKQWTGTLAEYNALSTKDANTLYFITDDNGGYVASIGGATGAITLGTGLQMSSNELSVDNAVKITIAWTNPNPSSSFSAQTVSFTTSNYAFLIMDFKWSTSSSVCRKATVIPTTPTGVERAILEPDIGTTDKISRNVTVNASGIVFNNGATNNSTDNTVMIPVRIYGIS